MNFFAGSSFVLMVFKDTSFTRGIFFAAFTTYVLTVTLINLYFTLFMLDEDQELFDAAVKERCQQFQQESAGFDDTPFADMEDCVKHVEQTSKKASFVITALTFLIQSHFSCVIFTHWKKAHLPRSKGGCMPEVGQGDI